MNIEAQRHLLEAAKVIAVVGHSEKPHRTSYQIANYLRQKGYVIYPVNPSIETIDGETSYPDLASLPERPDMVNVFRRAEHLKAIVEAANRVGAGSVWAQLGVHDGTAVDYAKDNNLPIITNQCIKVVHQQLIKT